jgi:hypothetical protein
MDCGAKVNTELQDLYGSRTITLAMHMALDFDKLYPNDNRKYSELVLTMIPAAVLIVLEDGI